jgi:uncharacterized Zn finger protein
MASVADLVHEEALRDLADRDAYEQGTSLATKGRVDVGTFGPLRVTAWVEGCEVELRTVGERLEWSCSCHAGAASLCAHAVAVAAETWRRAP